ncbi:histidine--tRNA ligase [Chitinivibrio alkaliphilus]|uniref:Histidine--tRNA ligase n=1 Tax=Chitinivibrio alkaliphilus ACht1 TaxID=1313304 RepID=U7D913_9BACT|nr:histidine--tRNA ligase [Chitinivibrio alkaliphilus]ERP38879.1 histidyl-tRNA synthetase [Chitinivibrio alkaliphilus ACht1]
MNYLPPKGTRDFYPEDMILREHIFTSWEQSCHTFGFEKYDAPVFEHLDLYTHKSGTEIEQQLYSFEDKGGRKLSLRPEMTPSVARMVAARGNSLAKPVKWYSIPKLFRYEKMQKGRLREFFQLNMDIIGIAELTADAELIAATIDTMKRLGLDSQDFQIHISSRNLLEEYLQNTGIPKKEHAEIYLLLDKMPKMAYNDFCELVHSTLSNQERAETLLHLLSAKTLEDIEKMAPDLSALSELKELFSYLSAMGVADYCSFDITIVRGLAYYTGIVFEVFDTRRSMRAIAGGGRYNRLIELYGGTPTPAVGFAMGDVVLSDLLREKGALPTEPAKCDVFVISVTKDISAAMSITARLRNARISTEFPLKMNAVGKQLKKAAASRCKIALLTGGEEEASGNYRIKIMQTGEEENIPMEQFKEALSARLENL